MKQTEQSSIDLVADLDVELVSALYRAAGEADAFDHLAETLQRRFAPEVQAVVSEFPQRVVFSGVMRRCPVGRPSTVAN